MAKGAKANWSYGEMVEEDEDRDKILGNMTQWAYSLSKMRVVPVYGEVLLLHDSSHPAIPSLGLCDSESFWLRVAYASSITSIIYIGSLCCAYLWFGPFTYMVRFFSILSAYRLMK